MRKKREKSLPSLEYSNQQGRQDRTSPFGFLAHFLGEASLLLFFFFQSRKNALLHTEHIYHYCALDEVFLYFFAVVWKSRVCETHRFCPPFETSTNLARSRQSDRSLERNRNRKNKTSSKRNKLVYKWMSKTKLEVVDVLIYLRYGAVSIKKADQPFVPRLPLYPGSWSWFFK